VVIFVFVSLLVVIFMVFVVISNKRREVQRTVQ